MTRTVAYCIGFPALPPPPVWTADDAIQSYTINAVNQFLAQVCVYLISNCLLQLGLDDCVRGRFGPNLEPVR